MESIEMVKCYLKKDERDAGSVRYIPLDIFEMWRVLMRKVHGFLVADPVVATWTPLNDDPPEFLADAREDDDDVVIEVSCRYSHSKKIDRSIVRYFPANDFEEVYGYFRNHFPDDKIDSIRRRRGCFNCREAHPYLIN
ncbi:MAG TPA: hypothetical protein PKW95_00245 [bacterium]|nr:hypothetical protein [bacterium]